MATKSANGEQQLATRQASSPFAPWSELNRAFNDFWSPFLARHPFLSERSGIPSLNMHREGTDLVVEAELPGIAKEDLKVNLNGDLLTIEAEHKSERKVDDKDRYLSEIQRGRIFRSVTLPVEIDSSNLKGEFANGCLKLRLPIRQPEQAQGVNIDIQ